MSIDALAERIAVSIKKANERETVSVPVMKFALIILINIVIPVIAALLIGLITGKLAETALSIVAFVLIRMMSGGYHFRSPVPCMTAMVVFTALPPHVVLPDAWTAILTGISVVLFALLAPSNLRGYHTMPERFYPYLKVASVFAVCGNFAVGSSILALVFFIQGVTLFKWREV
ncbi:accessory gene regulator ArgB-like protein [Paenibacillus flagellatus]|uniref:Post-translational modification of quorum-sensing peptide protein n=1 Tax=Paenibacillus flagellatus TaxID=2211139 RepID=A0A2V5KLB0_9BACL|nr:accessory gene regulator B family protein [Paenibacillus flagellatus]PYI51557.1 post-translational modification of quorum-sensing peptide protein [Paenibacillus flagellatus]